MKHDPEIMEAVRSAINDCTRGIDEAPSLRYQILKQAKGEPPVKKKFSIAVAIAMVMMLLVSGAFATTLFHSEVLSWLFRNDETQPSQEIVDLLEQPKLHRQTDLIDLTLTETLYDGRKLSVSLTLENPTDEQLIYTISDAKLNGETLFAESTLLPYGGTYGQALGGEVNSQALSNAARVIATFIGAADVQEGTTYFPAPTPAPLQATDAAEFSLLVEVYRAHAPLAYLTPGENLTDSTFLSQGVLALEQETNLVQLKELLDAPDPSLLEKVESQVFTFPIHMSDIAVTTVSAAPGVYGNELFSLEVEAFNLSATSGLLKGTITIPAPVSVKDQLPKDMSFFLVFPEDVYQDAQETNNATLALQLKTQSGSGYIDLASSEPAAYEIDASFGATPGTLPTGVYLVWMTDNNGVLDWDTSLYIPMK